MPIPNRPVDQHFFNSINDIKSRITNIETSWTPVITKMYVPSSNANTSTWGNGSVGAQFFTVNIGPTGIAIITISATITFPATASSAAVNVGVQIDGIGTTYAATSFPPIEVANFSAQAGLYGSYSQTFYASNLNQGTNTITLKSLVTGATSGTATIQNITVVAQPL